MIEGPITQANAVMFLRARHLTTDGRDYESETRDIARQRAYCQSKAERLGATIVKEYVEHGGTGPIASRPVMRQMLSDLRSLLGIRYVLAFGLDRLARKPEDLRALEQAIQTSGAEILDVSGPPVVAYYCNPEVGYINGNQDLDNDSPDDAGDVIERHHARSTNY